MAKDESAHIGTAAAIIQKVTNTADGGLRITLDITAQDVKIAAELLQFAAANAPIFVTFVKKHGF